MEVFVQKFVVTLTLPMNYRRVDSDEIKKWLQEDALDPSYPDDQITVEELGNQWNTNSRPK